MPSSCPKKTPCWDAGHSPRAAMRATVRSTLACAQMSRMMRSVLTASICAAIQPGSDRITLRGFLHTAWEPSPQPHQIPSLHRNLRIAIVDSSRTCPPDRGQVSKALSLTAGIAGRSAHLVVCGNDDLCALTARNLCQHRVHAPMHTRRV